MYSQGYKNMTLELNASDDRGIDVVPQRDQGVCWYRRLFSSGIKLIVLDEADMMTNDAQFALRRIIEIPRRTALLSDLQLREQDHSRSTVAMRSLDFHLWTRSRSVVAWNISSLKKK